MLKINLLRRGYQAETAGSGECHRDSKAVVPDLILLDIKLPAWMDGRCRKIKEDQSMCGISIIVVSAAENRYSEGEENYYLSQSHRFVWIYLSQYLN